MHNSRILTASMLVLAGVIAAFSQPPAKSEKQQEMSATERSVREFFDSYAEDLRGSKREAIADRYDRRGVYMVGNGSKSLVPFEQVKERYLTKWSGPKSFSWKDLSVEVISNESVVVTGLFEWQTAAGTTYNYSYTGLLIKQEGKWRIRLEDESTTPTIRSN
ncbi:MAG TPA: DUF4440 domain-containing protein [Pyrinomonadaceae bacterium]|nr:DUF4440 domain-containing protein [Pyrinomonadaceae bacterium]